MKNKRYALLALSVILLITFLMSLVSCKGIVIDEKNNNGKIEVKNGSRFSIVLDSNPTTGYDWYMAEEDYKANLSLIGSEYSQSRKEKGLMGAGGKRTFTFLAEKSGSTNITLEYKREFEKDVEPIDNFSVDIIIK